MAKEQWHTKGIIPGRRPGSAHFYDLDYFAGHKKSLGIQFPENGSYMNPNSAYRHKFQDTLEWIRSCMPGGKLLDVGSGPAHLTHWAKRMGFPLSIVSCDVSQPILDWAQDHNGATSVVSKGYELPFRDGSFDGVLFADVLEHMWPEQAQIAAQEAFRILQPGGSIFINIPNRVTWSDAAKRDQGHVWLPTTCEMRNLLYSTGFAPETIHHFTRGFPKSAELRRLTGKDSRAPILGRSIFISAQKSRL